MKTIHKLLALALCLTLLCGAVSATMRETGTSGLKLADEVTYTHTSWSNDQKEGQYLQEHFLTYTSGGAVRPMVVYGNTLYGRSPMNYAAKFLEDKNLVLVAGVNGSFFDMHPLRPHRHGGHPPFERKHQLHRLLCRRQNRHRYAGAESHGDDRRHGAGNLLQQGPDARQRHRTLFPRL